MESFQFENGKEEIIVGAPTYQDDTTGQTTGKSDQEIIYRMVLGIWTNISVVQVL